MLRIIRFGVGLGVVLLGAVAHADTVLYTATVTVPEAEVRSGAGDNPQLYPTNRLRKGDRVEVVKELPGGWLAIKPPAGSFSWVNTRFVRQVVPSQPMWVIEATPDTRVPLLMGSDLRSEKPTVEGARVERGTQLRSIGPERVAEDGKWLPVEPPPAEVRYIRKEQVSLPPTSTATTPTPATVYSGGPSAVSAPVTPAPLPVPAPGGVPGNGTPTAAPTPTSAPAPTPAFAPAGTPTATAPTPAPTTPTPVAPPTNDPRWLRAQQTEQAGRYQEAAQLYMQLGNEVVNTNHALAVQAYNRAQWLTRYTRGAQPLTPNSPQHTQALYPGAPPAGSGQPAPVPPNAIPPGWVKSSPGRLMAQGYYYETRKIYRLENSRGIPLVYVVPGPGVSLDPYINRTVELYGPQSFREELRANLLTAMRIQLIQ